MALSSSDAVSFTDSIRAAGIEKHIWERIHHQSVDSIQDSEIISSIAIFLEQIQSNMVDLERNLTSLLEEFDGVLSNSSTLNWDMSQDGKDGSWYHPSLQESPYSIASFNYSLVGNRFLC